MTNDLPADNPSEPETRIKVLEDRVMILTKLENDYLRSVDKIGKGNIAGATLGDIARDLKWTEQDFATATAGLRHYGYILVTGALVTLSPMGRNEIQ